MSRTEMLTIQVGGLGNTQNERTALTRQIAESLSHNNPLARVVVIAERDAYHRAEAVTQDPGTGFEGTIKISDGSTEKQSVELHVQRWDMPDSWDKKDDPVAQRSPFRLTATNGQLKSMVDHVLTQDIFPLPKKPTIRSFVFEEVETTTLTAGKASRTVELPAKWFGTEFSLESADRHESYSCEGMARGVGSFSDVLNINRPGHNATGDDPQLIHFNSLFTLFVDMDLAVYSLEILDRSLVIGNGLSAPQYKLIEIELE